MSAQHKLILSIVIFFSIVVIVITSFSYQSFKSSSYNNNKEELVNVATAINRAVSEKMNGYFSVLELAAKMYNLAENSETYTEDEYKIELLVELSKQAGDKEAYYGLEDGTTFSKDAMGQIPNFNAKDLEREWYRRIFNGETRIVTTPYVSSIGETVMALGVGIYDGSKTIGTLCINLLMSEITEFTKGVLDFENIYLTRDDGYLMASRDEESIGLSLWEIHPELEQYNRSIGNSSFEVELDGEIHEVSISIINSLNWKVWTFEKRRVFLSASIINLIINIIIAVFSMILSTVMVKFLVSVLIFKPLEKVKQSITQMEQGDLTRRELVSIRNDEIGSLILSMENMIEKLREVVTDVRIASDTVAIGSRELARGNEDLSNRTESQASALEETSAAIEEMNGSIRSNADNTIIANQLSLDVSTKADEGSEAVNHMIQSMNEISISSQRISDIIEVINNIAFQTNLLALNASIEAARAGVQGKGFAVVAVEVRKLAKRSDKAAAQITEIIKSSNTKVLEGVEIANTAGNMLGEINSAVKKVTNLIGEISFSSQEQLSSVDQIDQTLSSLDTNTQKNASLVAEAAAATEQLSSQAVDLNRNMQFFKIDSSKELVKLTNEI